MKTIAYLRVSTIDQDTEKFQNDILRFANSHSLVPVEFVEEKVSGKIPWRKRKIASILDALRGGDNLIVPELSRLGRTSLEIMEMLKICTERKINVFDIKSNWKLDDSIQSKIVSLIFSMFAEIERDLISMRTKEALRVKKESGKKLGRPKGKGKSKLDDYEEEIKSMVETGVTQKRIAAKYGVRRSTLYNFLKMKK